MAHTTFVSPGRPQPCFDREAFKKACGEYFSQRIDELAFEAMTADPEIPAAVAPPYHTLKS